MTAQPFSLPSSHGYSRTVTAVDRARRQARSRRGKPRMAILAPTALDAVQFAGGLIFDRSTAGWDVTVVTGRATDPRPVHILGAEVVELQYTLGDKHGLHPHALAVAADMFASESWLYDGIRESIERRTMEVSVWGRAYPAALDDRVRSTTHELSRAARVFKRHALSAVGVVAADVPAVEYFCTAATQRCTPTARDLVPAS